MTGRIVGSGAKALYYVDGKPVSRRRFKKLFPDRVIGDTGGHRPSCWPMACDAVGVHPRSAQKQMEEAARRGVPTEINGEGQVIFRDAGHRRAYCEAFGFFDRNGGYGDPQRKRGR